MTSNGNSQCGVSQIVGEYFQQKSVGNKEHSDGCETHGVNA